MEACVYLASKSQGLKLFVDTQPVRLSLGGVGSSFSATLFRIVCRADQVAKRPLSWQPQRPPACCRKMPSVTFHESPIHPHQTPPKCIWWDLHGKQEQPTISPASTCNVSSAFLQLVCSVQVINWRYFPIRYCLTSYMQDNLDAPQQPLEHLPKPLAVLARYSAP